MVESVLGEKGGGDLAQKYQSSHAPFPGRATPAYMAACGLEMASLSLVEAAHAGGTVDKGNSSSSSQNPWCCEQPLQPHGEALPEGISISERPLQVGWGQMHTWGRTN